MESVINKAIEWFKTISEATRELTSGNVAHKSCAIRGMANRSSEYLEKHKRNLSVIKWQTGEPKENDLYIVSLVLGKSVVISILDYYRGVWLNFSRTEFPSEYVIAWCKLSDIKPFKEETR